MAHTMSTMGYGGLAWLAWLDVEEWPTWAGWLGWRGESGRNGAGRALHRAAPWRPGIPDWAGVKRACRGNRLTRVQVGIWGRKVSRALGTTGVCLIAMHLAACTLLPPVGPGLGGVTARGVGKVIPARRAETGRPYVRVRALPGSTVGGADSSDFISVLIDVVEGSVEWVVSKVLSDIGDEFVFVHNAQDPASVGEESDTAQAGDEEGSSLDMPVGTVGEPAVEVDTGPGTVTAQVSLLGVEQARGWLREMLRVTGYTWYHGGGRWWISRGHLGGNWIWIGERAGWEIARERGLDCVRGWCRAMGEDVALIKLLADPEAEVRSVSAIGAKVLEEMDDVVHVVEVAGGSVAWGPAWAFKWIDRVIGAGECIGLVLDVPVPVAFTEKVASWREKCAVGIGVMASEVWIPREVDVERAIEVLGVRGSWVLAARVWSAEIGGGAAFDGILSASVGVSEAEGVYLARIPWGPGEVGMTESTEWTVSGASVTVESGAVVSETDSRSVHTGVTWKGHALPNGVRGLVQWQEGVREEGQVRRLECAGEIDAVEGVGWMTVCGVTGRNAAAKVGFWPIRLGVDGRDRRYVVEAKAWREGRTEAAQRFGGLLRVVRRIASLGGGVYADYRDRWETGGWQKLFGVSEDP